MTGMPAATLELEADTDSPPSPPIDEALANDRGRVLALLEERAAALADLSSAA